MNLFQSFDICLGKICARPHAPWMAWIHQIHATRGVGSSTTMVVVFVVCLCCVLHLVWLSSCVVCKKVQEDTPKVGLWV
jgi:hypothetical protein